MNNYQPIIDNITKNFPLIDTWKGDYQTFSGYKYGIFYTNVKDVTDSANGSIDNLYSILQYADTNHIPLFIDYTRVDGGCGICNSKHIALLNSQTFANSVTKSKFLYYTLGTIGNRFGKNDPDTLTAKNTNVYKMLKLKPTSELESFGYAYLYWNIDDSRIIRTSFYDTLIITGTSYLYKDKTVSYPSFDVWYEKKIKNYIEDCSTGFTVTPVESVKDKLWNAIEYPDLLKISVNGKDKLNCTELPYSLNIIFNEYVRKKQFENNYILPYLNNSYYNVSFFDYDYTQIGETQSVLSGFNATPPENPTREGYNFTKWEPTFTNVTSDITCIAQYEEIYVPKAKKNYMRNQITKAQLSKNILSVGDYCFYNCYKLKDVELGDYCRLIGTSAFKDCTELSSVNRLNDSNPDHTFDIVGDYAFSNTNLSSVTLSLRGSSSFTFWGDYCFAYNRNLKRVNFLSSSYMSNNMFCDCSSLTSVTFDNNYTSYVYPYVFHNCTALKDITLPSKLWFISNSMFKGCSSLSSIKFSSYKNTSLNLVQDSAFNGCSSLTSIEFPESINSLSCFEDGCFQNMPNLREIRFDGIETEDLMVSGSYDICSEIQYGKMYINRDDSEKIINHAISNDIPFVACRGGLGCGFCSKFVQNYKEGGELANELKDIKCIFLYSSKGQIPISYTGQGSYVLVQINWFGKDSSGKKIKHGQWNYGAGTNRSSFSVEKLKQTLTSWGYDYKGSGEAFNVTTTVDSIKKTGCFRLNHDCTLISKDGTTVNFKYNPNDTEQKVEETEYEVDKSTKTNFQTGTWYYNMKQLKSYADKTGKPILGIYSLLGCDPCTIYHDNIWNNENLQSWISSQNFYFCGIESNRQTYYDDQLNYCVNNFVISANNYLNYGEELSDITNNAFDEYFKETKNVKTGVINTNLFTPVIMMYGPRNTSLSNQFYLYTYHNISKWIDQCGKDGVIEVLKRLCLYHFENNDPSSPNGFVRGVTEKFDKDNLPTKEQQDEKFKFYDQETGIVTLASYQTLSCLKEKLKSTFQDDIGEYVGGCQVETVQWMTEIGVDADIATNFPEQMKEEFEKVKQYKFSDTEKYTLSIDLDDTRDVYSPCNMGGTATGYRMVWTNCS